MPFFDEEFRFTQPDGTQFQVRGTGDQHSAVFETLDGYTIVENPNTGYYHYAKLDDATNDLVPLETRVGLLESRPPALARHIRPSADVLRSKTDAAITESPSAWQMRLATEDMALRDAGLAAQRRSITGSYVGLCLLVQFPDVPGTIPAAEVDNFCNKPGNTNFGNNGSVRDYFSSVSDGKLTYTNIVTPYYTSLHNRDYYTDARIPYHQRARELVREALAFHLKKGFDFSSLTTDSHDRVYALNVFYAGTRVNNWRKGLWPHSSNLTRNYDLGSGKFAYDYQITDMTDELTLGTFCHENGHMLCNFPDLYDKGYESFGASVFCLMCSGGKPPNHKNPLQVGAYLKHKAGWASAVNNVTPGATISLQAGRNDFAIYRKNPREYYIIENRQRAGRDVGLPDAGLAIWHVDEDGNNDHEQMTPAEHYKCALVQADGKNDLERNVNKGDAGDFFQAGRNNQLSDSTIPNSKWWDGTNSGLCIRDISASGSIMTFTALSDERRPGFLGRLFSRWGQ
jgi:M6 family metalloprotease-like protein